MNKNLAFLVIGGLVAIGLIGSIVLHLIRPETVAAFMPNVITLLGLIITAAGTIYGLGKVTEKVEEVRTQTNGTLSRRDAEIARLTQKLIDNGVDPEIPPHDEGHGR